MSKSGHSHTDDVSEAPVPVLEEAPEIPDPEPTGDVATDQKAAFAAALARKNAHAQKRAEHLDGQNNVIGSSTPGVSKRQFRRKSGG